MEDYESGFIGHAVTYCQLYSQKPSKDRFHDELDSHASYAGCDEFVRMISPRNYLQ